MQDQEKLREIEALGQEVGQEPPAQAQEPDREPSRVPLVQAALCLLALAGLFVLRQVEEPAYERFAQWYRQQASQEIALPTWGGEETPLPAATSLPQEDAAQWM